MAIEDAQEAPDVVIGIFSVNNSIVVVLFDYGASHSFISAAYVQKYNIHLAMLSSKMIVSSPGGEIHAKHVCPKVNVK